MLINVLDKAINSVDHFLIDFELELSYLDNSTAPMFRRFFLNSTPLAQLVRGESFGRKYAVRVFETPDQQYGTRTRQPAIGCRRSEFAVQRTDFYYIRQVRSVPP